MSNIKRKAEPAADAKDKKRKEEAAARIVIFRSQGRFTENIDRVFTAQKETVTTFIRDSIIEPLTGKHPTAEFSEFKLGQDGWTLVVVIKKRQYSIMCPTVPFAKVTVQLQGSGPISRFCQAFTEHEEYDPDLAVSGPGLAQVVYGKADEALSRLDQAVQSD